MAELRYKAWGEARYTSGTTPTSFRFTGQREESTIGLYDYGARWYDPALGRFIQPDPIVPEPGDPLALDRYAYAYNNPVKFVDPTGYDAMLVGGYGSRDWENPIGWKEWIMAYKGWTEEQWWTLFYRPWRAAADAGDDGARQAIMEQTGIHIFNWTACNCAAGDSISSSRAADIEWGLGALEAQMEGMEDITLIGHSKGGNLVYNYISAQGHKQPIKNAVIIAAPIYHSILLQPLGGLRPGVPWLNDFAKQSKVVVLNHVYDPVTLGPGQPLYGAINRVDTSLTSNPHAFHRTTRIAERALLVDLSVVGDRNARAR